jgi:hypothetical protein
LETFVTFPIAAINRIHPVAIPHNMARKASLLVEETLKDLDPKPSRTGSESTRVIKNKFPCTIKHDHPASQMSNDTSLNLNV